MPDGGTTGTRPPETTKEKSDRLKAARLEAESKKVVRVERATRKAAARRKVVGVGRD